jgi:hypothetical protein
MQMPLPLNHSHQNTLHLKSLYGFTDERQSIQWITESRSSCSHSILTLKRKNGQALTARTVFNNICTAYKAPGGFGRS